MVTLPGGDRAVVPPAKLADYLLSESHPVGRTKARYFRAAGFDERNAADLAAGLLAIARAAAVVEEIASPHGVKYVLDGAVVAPSGDTLRLRTVWIVEPSVGYPRFVTAYPAPGSAGEQGG
jgi:hypothetical protein